MTFPEEGRGRDDLLAEMRTRRDNDVDWRAGRTWSLVYHAGEAVEQLRNDAYELFAAENALNPLAFPSVWGFETEVVRMVSDLLGGGSDAVGNVTSGGTESIMLAVYAARERAAGPDGPETPEMVIPETGHPAWSKAGHYFGVEVVRTPTREDWRADVDAMEAAVTDDTVLVVASAPSYPHGVVDPVEDVAAMAADRGVPCHVDACIGGFVLPFLGDLGHDTPAFDLSVEGVTSVSVDPHKYGYAPKGTSVLLYEDADARLPQYYGFDGWSGGVYAAPNLQGTRPGGPIAGTWAVLEYLGREGYVELVESVMETTRRLRAGIEDVDGLGIVSDPDMTLLAVEATDPGVDAWAVHGTLSDRGWEMERQQRPRSLHLSVMPTHEDAVGAFLTDLEEAVELSRTSDDEVTTAPMYGMGGDIEIEGDVGEEVAKMLNAVFR